MAGETASNSASTTNGTPSLPAFVPFGVKNAQDRNRLLADIVKGAPKLRSAGGHAAALAAVLRPLFKRVLKMASSESQIALASGLNYVVDPTDHFAAGIAFGMLAEEPDLNTFLRLVEPSSIILDVGANFGLYTVESARLLTTGRVFSFEPVPEIFALLKRNIEANGFGGVTEAAACAVAAHPGQRRFYVSSEGSFSGLTDTGRAAVTREIVVKCLVIDELPALSNRSADLIKIDVEGAEAEVLRSARGLIARSPDVVIQFEAQTKNLTVENRAALAQVIEEFRQMGFELRAGWNNPSPGAPISPEDLMGMMTSNLYLARRASRGERRLLEAIENEKAWKAQQIEQAPPLEETLGRLIEQLRLEIRRTGHLEILLEQQKRSGLLRSLRHD